MNNLSNITPGASSPENPANIVQKPGIARIKVTAQSVQSLSVAPTEIRSADDIRSQIAIREAELKILKEAVVPASEAEAAHQYPLHKLNQSYQHFLQKIANAKLQLAMNIKNAAQLRQEISYHVGNSDDGNFNQFVTVRFPHLKDAPLYASIIEDWLTEAGRKLAEMETEMRKCAAELNLNHLLPDDLKS